MSHSKSTIYFVDIVDQHFYILTVNVVLIVLHFVEFIQTLLIDNTIDEVGIWHYVCFVIIVQPIHRHYSILVLEVLLVKLHHSIDHLFQTLLANPEIEIGHSNNTCHNVMAAYKSVHELFDIRLSEFQDHHQHSDNHRDRISNLFDLYLLHSFEIPRITSYCRSKSFQTQLMVSSIYHSMFQYLMMVSTDLLLNTNYVLLISRFVNLFQFVDQVQPMK